MNSKKAEIAHRKPIWKQLSCLYLDTELQGEDISEICNIFNDSPYDMETIKEIDLYEVFPVLQKNLFSVAGEWAGFDNEWLFEKCIQNFKKRKSRIHKVKCKFNHWLHYWMRRDYWNRIEEEMKKNIL